MKEFPLFISRRLENKLSLIDHKISTYLLNIQSDRNKKFPITFIDIDEEDSSCITFIQANKAAELLNVEDEKMFENYSFMFMFMGLGLLNMTSFKPHIINSYNNTIFEKKNHQPYREYIKSYYDHIHEKYNLDIINLNTRNTNTLPEKRIKSYDMIGYWDKLPDHEHINAKYNDEYYTSYGIDYIEY